MWECQWDHGHSTSWQPARPKHYTAPLVLCSYVIDMITVEFRMEKLSFWLKLFHFFLQALFRDGIGAGWDHKALQPYMFGCSSRLFHRLTVLAHKLLIFVEVVICKRFIYWLWGCVSAERRPLLTQSDVRSSHKTSEIYSTFLGKAKCWLWINSLHLRQDVFVHCWVSVSWT